MLTSPYSQMDLEHMRLVLATKLHQHPGLVELLRDSGERKIVEDCSERMGGSGLFWGAALMPWGRWVGENWLGVLWMELRARTLGPAVVKLHEGF